MVEHWPKFSKVIMDGIIFGGAAGLTSLIALLCIAYYFDLGSMQRTVDHLMP